MAERHAPEAAPPHVTDRHRTGGPPGVVRGTLSGPATARTPDERERLARDVRLAVGVLVLLVVGSGVSLEDDLDVELTGVVVREQVLGPGGLLLLAGSLPLAVRRAAPIPVLALVAAASLAHAALGYHPAPLPLNVLVALYTVAVQQRNPLVGGGCAAAYVLALVVAALAGWAPLTDDAFYIDFVSVVATVTIGYGVALGRARVRMAEQRATDVAREQETRTRTAVAQEQARIAREVHDIVAHDVSVMVAQAGAARRVFSSQPKAAEQALASIESVGRDALDGLRRLVGLLRTDREPDEHTPQPSIERLPYLLAQVQRAGLPVDLTIRGRPGPLPATVELHAYRIVQEALTNTLKHAGPTRASVVLTYEDTALEIEVRDEGRGATGAPSAGYGLIGMQQRVGMLGGELSSGSISGHGFRVAARLPVPGAVR